MKTVDSTSCWLALLFIIVSLSEFYPSIAELPIGGSFDRYIQQQFENSGHQRFQLEESPYNRFERGRRYASMVTSLSPSGNPGPNPSQVLSLDPNFNPWDSSSATQLLRGNDDDSDKDEEGRDDDDD